MVLNANDRAHEFEAERPRLIRVAGRILGDDAEAQDVVQQAWLRMTATETDIENLPAWLTTVTSRLCLDRLRARIPEAAETAIDEHSEDPDPADVIALSDSVGIALTVVLDRLSPAERVAFVMHDTFGFEFATIASALDITPTAARKLASRARAKVRQPAADDALADWEVVDAFMAAAREGDFERLLELLAPDAQVRADEVAIATGTPAQIERFAPGFSHVVRQRIEASPAALEAWNPNVVGGDIAGGAMDGAQLLMRQPHRLRKGLYLASASTAPGAGVHGMPGWWAAEAALRDFD
mgnify:CR=1 FL=1